MPAQMDAAARKRESTRKRQTIVGAILTIGFCASTTIATRNIWLLVLYVLVLAVFFGTGSLIVYLIQRKEMRRRAEGQSPSWFVQTSIITARILGVAGPRKTRDPMLTVFGHFHLSEGTLVWTPTKNAQKSGLAVGSFSIDLKTVVSISRLWGLGSQGYLQIRRPDGKDVGFFIRHPNDFAKVTGIPLTRLDPS